MTWNVSHIAVLFVVALGLPNPARALELSFPGPASQVAASSARAQHEIATGPFRDGTVETHVLAGLVQQFTWQITDASTASLQTTITEQLTQQGYATTFTCTARTCGGFDFRHALSFGSPPEMYVDLSDFTYITATRDSDTGSQDVALMISHGGTTGFVHLAMILPVDAAAIPVVQSSRAPDADTPALSDLIAQLTAQGSAPLDDLQFETSASQLSGDSFGSLEALAAFLNEDLSRRVVLVGHTDALGSLSGNIALSQARAGAVRRYLTGTLNVSPAQVEAQGIGYLSPRAPNTTAEGREANRRVEVVLANPG